MNKKQQSLLFKITIAVVLALTAYLVFRNTRNEVKGKVAQRVVQDIAKESGRSLFQ